MLYLDGSLLWTVCVVCCFFVFFFQAEDGIRDLVRSRGLGDVYKRQPLLLILVKPTMQGQWEINFIVSTVEPSDMFLKNLIMFLRIQGL